MSRPDAFDGIEACVFDAYGTLFNVHAPVAALGPEIGPEAQRLSQLWRQKQLEYTWLRSLMGRYADFWAITQDALDFAIATVGGVGEGVRARLLELYETLEPYPDAVAILDGIGALGIDRAILSNGAEPMLAAAVRSAGLEGRLEAVLSVDALRIYKPHPSVYRMAPDRFDTTPEKILFFSSNAWDIAGAGAFGFRTVWVNRFGQHPEILPEPPARVVETLTSILA